VWKKECSRCAYNHHLQHRQIISVIMSGDTHPHAYPPIEASSPLPGHNESRIEPPASLRPQYYATLAATLGGMVMGTSIGWSGPALTMLVGNSSATPPSNSSSYFHEFPVTVSQGNFIASLMPAGALVGGKYYIYHKINRLFSLKLSEF
jgi:hypothetical protein